MIWSSAAFDKATSARLTFIPEFCDVGIHPTASGGFRIVPLCNLLQDAIAGRLSQAIGAGGTGTVSLS